MSNAHDTEPKRQGPVPIPGARDRSPAELSEVVAELAAGAIEPPGGAEWEPAEDLLGDPICWDGAQLEVRDLTDQDITFRAGSVALVPDQGYVGQAQTLSMDELREQHHAIAKHLAHGHSVAAVCRMTGSNATTIGHLRQNPAFQSLVAGYAIDVTNRLEDQKLRMMDIVDESLEELRATVNSETDPEFLLKMVTSLGDRVGHGTTQRIETKSLSLSGRIANMKEKVKGDEAQSVTVIDAGRASSDSDYSVSRSAGAFDRELSELVADHGAGGEADYEDAQVSKATSSREKKRYEQRSETGRRQQIRAENGADTPKMGFGDTG